VYQWEEGGETYFKKVWRLTRGGEGNCSAYSIRNGSEGKKDVLGTSEDNCGEIPSKESSNRKEKLPQGGEGINTSRRDHHIGKGITREGPKKKKDIVQSIFFFGKNPLAGKSREVNKSNKFHSDGGRGKGSRCNLGGTELLKKGEGHLFNHLILHLMERNVF